MGILSVLVWLVIGTQVFADAMWLALDRFLHPALLGFALLSFSFVLASIACARCGPASCCKMSQPFIGFLLVLCFQCRVGEASNPGPCKQLKEVSFQIGTFNPTGLPNKAAYFKEYFDAGDLWLIAESHLSAKSMNAFRTGLRAAGSRHRWCVGGHPVAVRGDSQYAGSWNGVAVLSCHPTQALAHGWNPNVFQSSRVQVTSTLLHDLWVTSGVLYGETVGPDHESYLQHNETLLKCLIERVCFQSTGLRVIAGDFNVEEGDLPSFETLRQCGFRDLQCLAYDRWGQLPKPTCKHTTRKDFCFISPELQGMLQQVTVDHSLWPDHAVLTGHFRGSVRDCLKQIWPLPTAMPWPSDLDVSIAQWPDSSVDPTTRYHAIWQEIEACALRQSQCPIPKGALGRGRPIVLRKIPDQPHAPIPSGRAGEIQPGFHGTSLLHARWFRQVRRLQAYVQFISKPSNSNGSSHAQELWGAIRRGRGFVPDFFTWWPHASHRVEHAPCQLPQSAPDEVVARAIYESFTLEVRDLEARLRKTHRAYAVQRRELKPDLVFEDIRHPGPEGINLLFDPCQSKIVSVDPEFAMVELAEVVPWKEHLPVWCMSHRHLIHHTEDSCLWLDTVDGLEPGMTITQTNQKGGLAELAEEFRSTWDKRWNRHRNVPASQWTAILAFAAQTLRPLPCKYRPMTSAHMSALISTRKKRSARGLDGVALADLAALPQEALDQFIACFNHAEAGNPWPQQLLAGKVSSLAKCSLPRSASDFRPITVLGVLYRLWGTHHCKGLLQDMHPHLPALLLGSRPGCSATQVWCELAWKIEQSHLCGIPLCGLQADIVKAFNGLPREVVMTACAHLGVPWPVLKGWSSALGSLERFFEIRQSLTEPLLSTTGVPEGDAMSILAMLVIDLILHRWMEALCPQVSVYTFVDDWQLLVRHANQMPAAYAQLTRFCDLMDLQLDAKKTFCWALTSECRQRLKQHGFSIAHGGRTLGAHLQYTLQHTNSTVTKRVEAMQPLWDRLQMSQCTYTAKVEAIRMAAWPNALHGIFAVGCSQQMFSTLRSGAMRGLQAKASGANPWIQLGLIEQVTTDPAFWTLATSIRQVRAYGCATALEPLLADIAHCTDEYPANGITSTLVHRLQWLGWHILPHGGLRDQFGTFSLFDCSLPEILLRAEWSWRLVVSEQVRSRHGMSSFHLCDATATRRWLRLLPSVDQALFRKVLNGSFFIENAKVKWDSSVDDTCPFCACTDGRFHRWWVCDAFHEVRSSIPADIMRMIPFLPESLTCFGWNLLPHTWTLWQQYLAALRTPSWYDLADPPGDFADLFTDGSCFHPQHAQFRFAAFAVVQASSGGHDDRVLCAGPLPGLLQSAARSEIFACREALRWAWTYRVSVRIWVDSAMVVRRFQQLQRAASFSSINRSHGDLWKDIFDMLHSDRCPEVQICKVEAHCSVDTSESAFEDWLILHNQWAHNSAVRANLQRPPAFWNLFHAHRQAVEITEKIGVAVRQVQLAISRKVVQRQVCVEAYAEDSHDPIAPLPTETPEPTWTSLPMRTDIQPALDVQLQKFGRVQVQFLCDWFWNGVQSSNSPARWYSFYQLYIDFVGARQCGGPIEIRSQWIDPVSDDTVELVPYHFKRRCSLWARYFKTVMKHCGIHLHIRTGRPRSAMLSLHTSCVFCPWPESRLEIVESWLVDRLQPNLQPNLHGAS